MMPFGSLAPAMAQPISPGMMPGPGGAPMTTGMPGGLGGMPGPGGMGGGPDIAKLLQTIMKAQGGGAGAGGGNEFAGLLPILMGKAKMGGMVGGLMDMFKKPEAPAGLPMNLTPAFGVPNAAPAAPADFSGGLGGLY